VNAVRWMRWVTGALLAASLLLAGAAAALWLSQRAWFDVGRIEVHGEVRHISRAAVRAAVSGRLSGNYFTIRLDQVRRAFEALPWVAEVSVRRIWPNRLSVTLVEHRVLGEWSDGRLVSDAGVLFLANPAEAEAEGPLVSFSGSPLYAPQAVRHLHEFSAALAPLQIRIVSVRVSDRASWSLTTRPHLRVELGRDEPPGRLQARLATIAADFAVVTARLNGPPTRIDARYSNGFAAARTP